MLSLAWLVLLLVGSKAFRRPVAYVSTLHGKLARVGVAVSPNLDMGVDEGMRQESHSISTVDCVEGFFKQFNDMPHASTPEAPCEVLNISHSPSFGTLSPKLL